MGMYQSKVCLSPGGYMGGGGGGGEQSISGGLYLSLEVIAKG